jgi:hypothetical protein
MRQLNVGNGSIRAGLKPMDRILRDGRPDVDLRV